MAEILYLVHRIPFPPNKGEKIRSYHLLRYLATHHSVHLGCFIDSKDDEQYVGKVEKICKSIIVRPLNPTLAKLRSFSGFLSGSPLSVPYYHDRELAQWVDKTLSENPVSAIVAFSSPMGQYAIGPRFDSYQRIMDFVDIDSDKWRQYAIKTRSPMKWIYSREARFLSAYEQRVANEFDAALFVSEGETAMFAREHPELTERLHTVYNGVDSSYFNPEMNYETPFLAETLPIVFTGMMNYWPNVDAMSWFAKQVLPDIRRSFPSAELWIVGASPVREVQDLSLMNGVHVTGNVPDVRPYLKHAKVVVAPLRIARGVQNKVLEAMSMGQTVICTPEASAGLRNADIAPLRLANSEHEFVDHLRATLGNPECASELDKSRDYVLRNYDWDRSLSFFSSTLLSGDAQFDVGAFAESRSH